MINTKHEYTHVCVAAGLVGDDDNDDNCDYSVGFSFLFFLLLLLHLVQDTQVQKKYYGLAKDFQVDNFLSRYV